MGLQPFRRALDQENRRENQKSARDGSEADISKEVAQHHEQRYQAKAKPPRYAAQPFPDAHAFISGMGTNPKCGNAIPNAVRQVTWHQ
jgi:hypothetical protein